MDDPTLTALLERLAAAVGADRVRRDADPRTAEHVSGRSVGVPACWVSPRDTAQVAAVVVAARAAGASVRAVGEATTFWDGLRVDGAVVVDVRGLRDLLEVDVERRCALVGAGVTFRELDTRARRSGLTVLAYPDAAGDTSIGAMLAVGSTAGLGLGHGTPIEQVTGATLVSGLGEIVRVGASHAACGRPFLAHGLPSALGLVASAEGAGALITEVGVRLAPTPHTASATFAASRPLEASAHLATCRIARRALDRRTLDSLRVEIVAEGAGPARGTVFARTHGADDASAAASLATLLGELGAPAGTRVATESAASLRGEEPDYSERYSIPLGQHRARVAGGAFWGVEVSVSWGAELASCLERLVALFSSLVAFGPVVRRLGIYPGHDALSIGVQVLGRPGERDVAVLRAHLADSLLPLLELGAVPYRTGHLWRDALVAFEPLSAHRSMTARLFSALDPEGRLG
jgi:FAD/FMN-containing dehydrogenase